MNNAVFGKTMQSKRKEMKIELVSCDRRLQKLINKCTFKHCTNYNDNLNAVALENKINKFYKPIYIGFVVLDISKTKMYDYHYNVMKKHYKDKIKLMYTDTDSLVYHINTDDFYKDLAAKSTLLDQMDTANLPQDHPCYVAEGKKLLGYFSDEVDGNAITEFSALRAKSYAFNVYAGSEDRVGRQNIKAKGKNQMTLEDHKKCLFGEIGFELYKENVLIKSFNHQLVTFKTKKLTYNNFDDKRVILADKIYTLAHGHYSLEDDEEQINDWLDHEIDTGGLEWDESEKD